MKAILFTVLAVTGVLWLITGLKEYYGTCWWEFPAACTLSYAWVVVCLYFSGAIK